MQEIRISRKLEEVGNQKTKVRNPPKNQEIRKKVGNHKKNEIIKSRKSEKVGNQKKQEI